MTDSRPWLKNYPQGVPANINLDQYSTIVEFINEKFDKYPKRAAFSCMGKTMTYKEIDKLSDQFGAYLSHRGLEPGDRVAIMMPNLLQYPIALFGCMKAGITVVNTNPLYTPREMEHQFTDRLVDTAVKHVKRMVPKFELPNTVSFKEALKQGKKFDLPSFENTPERVIVHQYTGGTTGVSKGAMLTNRNLIANMLQIKSFWDPYIKNDGADEIVLSPLPMYHIYAFSCNCLAMLGNGAHTVLVTNPRDLDSLVKEFKNFKLTGMTGVNTLYNALNNNEDFKALDFSNFEMANAGGTALQQKVGEEWEKITGGKIAEGYGMTEASPVVTVNPRDAVRVGTIGIPVPSTDVRIVDEQGNPLPVGEPGEIQVKGPQVMKGYYNKPEATAKTITPEGWLNTGDIGLMEADGYFRIVDRKKDMILVSGFNVYPNEIEDVLGRHEKVDEVAAIGVPDDKSGEVVKIFVTVKDSTLKKDELIEYAREQLTGYKVPKHVEFIKELPKSTVGKILRRELRDKELMK